MPTFLDGCKVVFVFVFRILGGGLHIIARNIHTHGTDQSPARRCSSSFGRRPSSFKPEDISPHSQSLRAVSLSHPINSSLSGSLHISPSLSLSHDVENSRATIRCCHRGNQTNSDPPANSHDQYPASSAQKYLSDELIDEKERTKGAERKKKSRNLQHHP